MDFVHLHCHSEYSLLDGMSTPQEIANITSLNGQYAAAITDHGTMGGVLKFQYACKDKGVKPLFGVEAYFVPSIGSDEQTKYERFHLILLAKNNAGLAKLFRISQLGWTKNFYYKPRIDFELLEQMVDNDIIALSGCMGGAISKAIEAKNYAKADQLAERFIKIFGDDLDILRSQADLLRSKLSGVSGLVDLEIEKQVLAPQIKVRINYDLASQYGVSTSQVMEVLQSIVEGERLSQIIEGSKRFGLVLKLPETSRTLDGLSDVLIDTPLGRIPLSKIASLEDSDGPNQISRDDGKRRIVISANTSNRALSDVVKDIRVVVDNFRMPEGYFVTLGGQFVAQEMASKLIGFLSIGSLLMMFAVLYTKYKSTLFSLMIMSNIPLAMIGAVIGLWLSGQPLSIAALIGFITLAGISVRNGILKISHYLNLMRLEGEAFSKSMIVRGSIERLSPVLMTALVTAFALAPLLFEAERPGTEILHPVAVVIFSGLISSTLLDTFLTPAMFWLYGKKDAEKSLLITNAQEGY